MQYRRARTPGGTYFFTLVTFERQRILCDPANVSLLREIFKGVMERHPFQIDAFVLLPDHLHCIWTFPDGDRNFSTRWRLIKSEFSRRCEKWYRFVTSISRARKQEQTIWQRRFWEHEISSEEDFIHHVEYIHYNPVKHGLVQAPKEWTYSSFHRYVRQGVYAPNWGSGKEVTFTADVGSE
jgi:putative transposase